MKVGTITPLFKKGNKKLISNYRPVSVLPTVAKIFEKILFLQLNNYFVSNNLISKSQYGFRKNLSTVHAIQNLLDSVFKAFESKMPALSLHFDLAKAFDTIDHEILLGKLKLYGLNDSAMKLLPSYLSNRQQMVKFNTPNGDVFSKICQVNAGVPQGSILGPLLFNIFINDLPKVVDYQTYLFADDTTVVLTGPDALASVKSAFSQVSYWFKVNGLKLNEQKSQALYYTPSVLINPPSSTAKLSDTVDLDLSPSSRFLGIHIDQHLNWKTHVEFTINKIQSHKWALRNLVKVASKNVALIFYHANIVRHLRYGLILWGGSPHAERLFVEQKKIIRILFNLPFNHTCKETFKNNDLLTLPSLFIFESLKYSILNNIIKQEDLFPSHCHSTRHTSVTPQVFTYSVSKLNIKNASIKLFNALPLNLRIILKAGDIGVFLKELKVFVQQNAFYRVDEFLLKKW